MRVTLIMVLVLVTACGGTKRQPMSRNASATVAVVPDTTRTASGGVPAGYIGRTDNEATDMGRATYRTVDARLEITTGPAHILYSPADTIRGAFIVATTFNQLAPSAHAEAYGIFVGGTQLDQPTLRYTCFLVRGTGEYLVRVREGGETRDVVGWTAHSSVPRTNTDGKGGYRLAVQAGDDSVRFLSNGTPVAAVARGTIPTDGIFGIRVNHNLHVMVDPLRRSGN